MVITGETTYMDGFRNRTAKVGKCECGEEVILMCLPPAYACDCPNCGQWYNASGQKLKPPSEWQEDY